MSLALLCLLLFGCSKTERVYIPDNEAPPDSSVSTLKLETYINKCYIGLLGRRPLDAEMAAAVATLRDSSLSSGGRKLMLSNILDQEEFLVTSYTNDGDLLLNKWDTALYAFFLYQFMDARQDPNNAGIFSVIDTGIAGLTRLLDIPTDFTNGTIDTRTMHKYMVNNYVYDEVNMGSENLVRSVFDHFLQRNPTNAELTEGIKMVDGFEAVLFAQTGDSRYDFMEVFFNHNGYAEGQVRWAFQRFLFRDAETEELAYYTNIYQQNGDRKLLFTELLSLNEYAGF